MTHPPMDEIGEGTVIENDKLIVGATGLFDLIVNVASNGGTVEGDDKCYYTVFNHNNTFKGWPFFRYIFGTQDISA